MELKDTNISMGTLVSITLKSDNSKTINGMVKRIMRNDSAGIMVELLDGSVGVVKEVIVKKVTPHKAIKELRDSFKKSSTLQKEIVNKSKEEEIFEGESKDVEYKTSALWSQDLSKNELDSRNTFETRQYGNRASKIILAKAICAFLNTEGGNLIIGIKEQKEVGRSNAITGIESEFSKLRNKDPREDGYRRMIIDEVIKPYFPETIFNHFNNYISISFPKKENKTLCKIAVKKSDHNVFITIDNKDHFFIKVDAETRELYGKQIVDYVRKVWG